MLYREPEPKVIPACDELGLGLLPYYPLESGLLTGKFRKGEALPEGTRLANMTVAQRQRFLGRENGEELDQVERLQSYAQSQGHTLLELAMSWLASNQVVVSVIAGATRPEQVTANAAAVGWNMTDEDRAAIDAYVWRGNPESTRQRRDPELAYQIRKIP